MTINIHPRRDTETRLLMTPVTTNGTYEGERMRKRSAAPLKGPNPAKGEIDDVQNEKGRKCSNSLENFGGRRIAIA
jgi:hypothetical protein